MVLNCAFDLEINLFIGFLKELGLDLIPQREARGQQVSRQPEGGRGNYGERGFQRALGFSKVLVYLAASRRIVLAWWKGAKPFRFSAHITQPSGVQVKTSNGKACGDFSHVLSVYDVLSDKPAAARVLERRTFAHRHENRCARPQCSLTF